VTDKLICMVQWCNNTDREKAKNSWGGCPVPCPCIKWTIQSTQ